MNSIQVVAQFSLRPEIKVPTKIHENTDFVTQTKQLQQQHQRQKQQQQQMEHVKHYTYESDTV